MPTCLNIEEAGRTQLAIRKVVIGGIPLSALSSAEWCDLMVSDWKAARERFVPTKFMTSANGNVMSRYHSDSQFKELMDQSDGIDVDGMPLVLASRLLAQSPLPERVATTDFFHVAARRAEEHGISFYFLGGTEQDNIDAVRQVRHCYPKLQIAGRHNGYFEPSDEEQIVQQIVAAGTDVLWVAMGVPSEHQFIVRNRAGLQGVAWAKTCGGLFKFLSGKDLRAPLWMQNLCLEWLYRLWREPQRLFWRYVKTNVHAVYLILKYRAFTNDNGWSDAGQEPTTTCSSGATTTDTKP